MAKASYLEIYDTETDTRTVLKKFDYIIEAPNWMPESMGDALMYNSKGKLWRFDLGTLESSVIDTGRITGCNNDHVISSDGKMIAISAGESGSWISKVFTLPSCGGEPVKISRCDTDSTFLHGVSPDKKTFVTCSFRKSFEGGQIISIDEDGNEKVLTSAGKLNDGPEFSSDGSEIWFNSERTGLMQAWKMKPDGSCQTQMTYDEDLNTWFPHISPDGKKVVMICYRKGDLEPNQHLPDKNVLLRLMDSDGGNLRTIAPLFGGQGTINVNSWSPDSKKFAFVSYE